MRKIYMYKSEEGTFQVEEFIKKSHHKIKSKFDFMLKMVAKEKNFLKEPYVKHFSVERYKKLYELRLKAASTMVRIIYFEVNGDIILLHAFHKKDNRDTEQALEHSLKIIEKMNNQDLTISEFVEEVAVG